MKLSALFLVATLAFASTASAQQDLTADARVHFDLGVKLYSEEDYRGALVEFRRAHELSKRWSLLYNIGQCAYELSDYAGALRAFDQYLTEGADLIPAARKEKLTGDTRELRLRVARLKVQSSVPDADVTFDEEPIGKTPMSGYIVNIGRHRIAVAKAGYLTETKNVELAGGDSPTLAFDLKPEHSETMPPTEPPPKGSKTLLVTGLAVTGVGAAVGVIFGVRALDKHSQLDGDCRNGICPKSSQSTYDAMNVSATISTIGIGVAVVGMIITGYALLSTPSSKPKTAFGPDGISGVF